MQIDDLCEIREIPLILSVVNFSSFFFVRESGTRRDQYLWKKKNLKNKTGSHSVESRLLNRTISMRFRSSNREISDSFVEPVFLDNV